MEFLQTRFLIVFSLLEWERRRELSAALAEVTANTLNACIQYHLLHMHQGGEVVMW